jgi:hypothetical protein
MTFLKTQDMFIQFRATPLRTLLDIAVVAYAAALYLNEAVINAKQPQITLQEEHNRYNASHIEHGVMGLELGTGILDTALITGMDDPKDKEHAGFKGTAAWTFDHKQNAVSIKFPLMAGANCVGTIDTLSPTFRDLYRPTISINGDPTVYPLSANESKIPELCRQAFGKLIMTVALHLDH